MSNALDYGDSREVSIKMLQLALEAARGVPDHLRYTFLMINAHQLREAADMIEAHANAEAQYEVDDERT